MTTVAGLRLKDYWPDGTPPCAVCGGVLGSGYGDWVVSGGSVREHRTDAERYGAGDLLLPGASDAGTGWTPVCSDFCVRFAFEAGPGRVLARPAPIEGTMRPIEPSWGPCAVCGHASDNSDEDWGPWASHWMSVKEYRVTRTREDDQLRREANDDSWARLCSDACERVAFPEDFIDDTAPLDVKITDSPSGLESPAATLGPARESHGGAPTQVRRTVQAGVATLTRWCHTRLVGKGS